MAIRNTMNDLDDMALNVTALVDKATGILNAAVAQGYTELEVDIPFNGPLHNVVEKFLGKPVPEMIAITVKVKVPVVKVK